MRDLDDLHGSVVTCTVDNSQQALQSHSRHYNHTAGITITQHSGYSMYFLGSPRMDVVGHSVNNLPVRLPISAQTSNGKFLTLKFKIKVCLSFTLKFKFKDA